MGFEAFKPGEADRKRSDKANSEEPAHDGAPDPQNAATPAAAASAPTSSALIDKIADWLMEQALQETDIECVVAGTCERLRAAGIPITRGHFAFTILHPLHRAIGITWHRGEETTVEGYPHVPGGISETYRRSPHFHMQQHDLSHLRAPLFSATAASQFPIFDDLRADGLTDYFAFLVGFGGGERSSLPEGFGMAGSWSTDEPTGFRDCEIAALLRIEQRLAVACKLAVKERLMRNVTTTYLGNGAATHVLDGQIQRGDGQSIKAAIWYSDMRGSSVMADTMERQEFIETLNTYFDVTGGAVQAAGGEILSFIGDALLAIFPTDGQGEQKGQICGRVISAARDARQRLADVNAERTAAGKQAIEFGTALHLGEVMYGNVGVPERLTFSVFGAAINEVARLEGLTKALNTPVLVSDVFSKMCGQSYRDLGCHQLRGIGRDMCVYAPMDLTGGPSSA